MNLSFALTPQLPFLSPRKAPKCAASNSNQPSKTKSPRRRVLATDLDGTLLTTSKNIHPVNTVAIMRALRTGLVFLPATGKSPSGAFRAMGELGQHLLGEQLSRGVFLNGLFVRNNHYVIYERFLCHTSVRCILSFARKNHLVALFYHRDSVFVESRNQHTDIFIASHEPVPTEIGSFERLGTVNKALLLDPRGRVTAFRAELEVLLKEVAVITQARHDVLEVMPKGVNKATGLQLLLDDLGVGTDDVVAVGDNENDLDMIRMAGLGVAVGNAVPALVQIADEVVCRCDEGAVAEVLTRFVL